MRIDAAPLLTLPGGLTGAATGQRPDQAASAAFEAIIIAEMLEQAGVGGDQPEATLARRTLAEAIAAHRPLGLDRLLAGLEP